MSKTNSHKDRLHSGANSKAYEENYKKIDWTKGPGTKSYIVDKKLAKNKTRYATNR